MHPIAIAAANARDRARRSRAGLALAAALLSIPLCTSTPARADDHVGWNAFDGSGGPVMTGDVYRLQGMIGQWEPGRMASGSTSLVGGFWAASGFAYTAGVMPNAVLAPPAFRLTAPAPNPAFGRALVAFDLAADAEADLRLYDVSGRCVRTLASGRLAAGHHAPAWDGTDDAGRRLVAGIYFLELRAGALVQRRKLVLLR